MKSFLFCVAAALSLSAADAQAKEAAEIVCEPSPLNLLRPTTITVHTSDLGSDVYLFAWVNSGYDGFQIMRWEQALDPKYKFSGSDGTYTMTATFADLFNMPDFVASSVTSIGFIARNETLQTEDMILEVVYTGRESYSGGYGTPGDPFLIATTEDLDALSKNPSHWEENIHVRLACDIEADEFSGIGTVERPYRGVFDGGGHTISNLRIAGGEWDYTPVGFFRVVDGGRISHLGIRDAEISGAVNVGALAGTVKSGTIERCYSSGLVRSVAGCCGGLVGSNDNAVISDCYSACAVSSASGEATGGFIGKNSGTVQRCYASGEVSGAGYSGGFAGANYGSLSSCVTVSAEVNDGSDGGFVGKFGGNGNPENRFSDSLSWPEMKSVSADRSRFGHQGDAHGLDLAAQSTYGETLGWNFDEVWEWKGSSADASRRFALLRGLGEQPLPSDEFFGQSGSGVITVSTESLPSVRYNRGTDSLNVADGGDDIHVRICNSSGILMMKVSGKTSVDCSRLSAGVYLVSLTCDAGTSFCKFVK